MNYYSNIQYGYPRPMSYKSLQKTLALVKQSVQGEKEDELFYDYLISVAPIEEKKEIIRTIHDDEIKHNKMFKQIYKDFTGQVIMAPQDVSFEKPDSYLDGIKRAFLEEHADKYNYILNLNVKS